MSEPTILLTPKKRGRKANPSTVSVKNYFDAAELAIPRYLSSKSADEKNIMFRDILDPALKQLVRGVMKMPKFQKIIGIQPEQLEEDTYYHVVFQLDKFTPGRIGKDGQEAKAYSYYSTVAKNYILGKKQEADKRINEHGGMVELETIQEKIADTEQVEVSFEELRTQVLVNLDYALENKKMNENDIVVGNILKYMLTNWHKLEFQSKNEFVRLLCQYTQLNPPIVARSLKKFKSLVYDIMSKL